MVSQRLCNQLDNCYSNRKKILINDTWLLKKQESGNLQLITSELKLIYYENSMASSIKNQTNYQEISSEKIAKQN